jgi:two-component system, OmpR family, heavy metal sensor histidine kinase CusS
MNAAAWRLQWSEASLAFRIGAAVALFGLFVALSAATLGYWALARQLDTRLEAELVGKRDLLLHLLSEMPDVQAIAADGRRFGDLLIGHNNLHLVLVDPSDGRLLASFSAIATQSAARLKAQSDGDASHWSAVDGSRYASLAGEAPLLNGQKVAYVVTLDPEDDRTLLQGFVRATALSLPVLLALVALGAWAVARTGLAPLKRLNAVAAGVTTNNLAQRLDVEGLPRELAALAAGLNAMLVRIDAGVHRLSEFSGDLAHEMRTPVATLLGRTQVALSRGRSAVELSDVLAGNVEELDRLTRLIGDMLFLAQADQDDAAVVRVDIDLTQETRRVAEFLSIVADEREVTVEVNGHARVQADQILVQRALMNLLSNAIRHADAGSTVSVALRRDGASAQVSVSNRGPGIPSDQLDRIFQRFVRLDDARARSDGGTGLGLPIVKSVMRAHGGDVLVASEVPGMTTFTLVFRAP